MRSITNCPVFMAGEAGVISGEVDTGLHVPEYDGVSRALLAPGFSRSIITGSATGGQGEHYK